MKRLAPHIKRHKEASLFPTPTVMPEDALARLRKTVIEAISLGLEDKLPEGLLRQVGLQTEANPRTPPDDGGLPF